MEQELAKYEGEPLPAKPRLHRAPRWKRPNMQWEVRRLKVMWLKSYRACGDIALCNQRIGRGMRTFEYWRGHDPAFKEEYLALKKMREEVMGEVVVDKLTALDLRAVEVVEGVLNSSDPELAGATAFKLLKAHGRLVEKQVVEHEGQVKVIHTVEVIQPKEE